MTFNIHPSLPIKYTLGVHPALPTYPTRQDFVFDIAAHIVRVTELKSKDWSVDDIKFSTKTLKYVFGDRMQSAEFRDKIKDLLKSLLEDGTLLKKGDFVFIPESEFSKYYLTA
jgi:hypothetical protein